MIENITSKPFVSNTPFLSMLIIYIQIKVKINIALDILMFSFFLKNKYTNVTATNEKSSIFVGDPPTKKQEKTTRKIIF
jgi:hypothetical protein